MDYERSPFEGTTRVKGFATAQKTGLLLILLAAPWAFGSTPAWAWTVMVALAMVLLLVWSIAVVLHRELRVVWSPPCIVILLGIVYGIIQYYVMASSDPYGSREAHIKWIGYSALFWVALQTSAKLQLGELMLTAKIVAAFGALFAAFSLCQYLGGGATVYGQHYDGMPFGTFINHNHFAGLMELLIPVTLGLFMLQQHSGGLLLVGLALTIMITAVVLAGSRAGAVTVLLEIVVLSFVGAARGWIKMRRKQWCLAALILASIVVSIGVLDRGASSSRYRELALNPEATFSDRVAMALDAVRLWKLHPIIGAGFGSYGIAALQVNTLSGERVVDHAHNDYLELLAEGGVVGALLALCWLVMFLKPLRSQFKSACYPQVLIVCGFAIGCCGLLLHAFVDFNFHIPANAAWFAVYAGIVSARVKRTSASGHLLGQ